MAPICQHRGCGCLAVCGISGQVKEQLPDLLCTAPAQVIPEIRHCVTGCGVSTETSCAARSAQFEGAVIIPRPSRVLTSVCQPSTALPHRVPVSGFVLPAADS
ncbi:uncharacterized protein LOC144868941 isoform X2 [Branchiostoma floridae x Branchiostoma japonicum]